MMHIDWSSVPQMGIPEMDEDHRQMVHLLNRFFGIAQDDEDNQATETLDELIKITRAHFVREEALLDKHGYPELHLHKAEHDGLLRDVGSYLEHRKRGEVPKQLTFETAQFLLGWLREHILRTDIKYPPFLRHLGT
jgi:hemerythrin